MKIENLQRLTKRDIEETSIKVLKHYRENYFTSIKPTPLTEIVKNLVEKGHLKYDEASSLGFSADGSRILGCYLPTKKTILIDSVLKGTPTKFSFVLGHELGHFVLHRSIEITDVENDFIPDTDIQILGERRQLKTDVDFMEWQANYFASTMLLPREILCRKLILTCNKIGVSWRGRIYVDNQRCNQKDYSDTLRILSEYFMVSKTVVEIRLNDLELIEDHRNDSSKSKLIGNIMKGMNIID